MCDLELVTKFIHDLNGKIQYLGLSRKEMDAILDLLYREED